jgi:exodeoxyribonuclease X
MTRIRVIDLETTGLAPPAEIIEIGRSDLVWGADGPMIENPLAWLYRPLNGIPPENMAVHHITEDDFGPNAPACTSDRLRAAIFHLSAPEILVAHNCEFERQFITPEVTGAIPWICTLKVALRVWPDAPRHSNQVLRYWRGMKLDHARAMPPHRAGPDAWVTAHILADLAQFASFDEMIAWTNEPKLLPTMTFGKHRGAGWDSIPIDYLQWMSGQADMDADVLWNARREIARRQTQPQAQ